MMPRLAVVGDVHGDVERLRRLLAKLESFVGSLVFAGDYVDGGPDSAEVLELLSTLHARDPERYQLLCGNHDRAMLRYFDDGDFAAYAKAGGVTTLASYLPVVTDEVWPAFRRAVPAAHVALLRELSACWESEGLLISHTGFDPSRPLARDLDTMTHAEGWPIFSAKTQPRPLVVCGHYAQRGARPYVSAGLVCVDTGCGMRSDGTLAAFLVEERRFLTADDVEPD